MGLEETKNMFKGEPQNWEGEELSIFFLESIKCLKICDM